MKNINATNPVTVVVPVYGDWPSLKVCIDSLLDTIDDNDRVLLVNDCGPDANYIESNILKMISDRSNFSYERNPDNKGFVKTCNRAVLELDKTTNDIMLLNSDAALVPGTLKEMKDLFLSEKSIGALSPRSNNATICTIPIEAINQRGINRNFAYKLYKKYYKKYSRFTETPTAHGFCMLIRRSFIDQYGLFDEIFGRGYGEEVDFCQRLRAKGYVSAVSNWSFAYHLEARSFSMETKLKLLAVNGKVVKKRYPDYSLEVRDTIAEMKKTEKSIFSQRDQILVKTLIQAVKIRKKVHNTMHGK